MYFTYVYHNLVLARYLEKKLVQNLHSLLGVLDRVAFNIRVRVDFIVVTTLVSLVAKEVNVGEALVLDVAQAVGLVPSSGEHIERDLSTNGKGQGERKQPSSPQQTSCEVHVPKTKTKTLRGEYSHRLT
jgi:hypothetical protein